MITVVRGRRAHLELQARALARSEERAFTWVVVAMGEPELQAWQPAEGPTPLVVHVPVEDPARLPLARARNAGAARARAGSAEHLVLLDVDCLPCPQLVGTYDRALGESATRHDLLCGPVAYLPPPPPSGYDLDRLDELAAPHPARPAPPLGTVRRGGDHDLFWSLSFATTATTWRTLGGFHDGYHGYGGEDTDLGAKARAVGVGLTWLGSARAHHQHHPTSEPPRQHLDAILANARTFHSRWGRWPMTGWLEAFVDEGLLVRRDGGYEVA